MQSIRRGYLVDIDSLTAQLWNFAEQCNSNGEDCFARRLNLGACWLGQVYILARIVFSCKQLYCRIVLVYLSRAQQQRGVLGQVRLNITRKVVQRADVVLCPTSR